MVVPTAMESAAPMSMVDARISSESSRVCSTVTSRVPCASLAKATAQLAASLPGQIIVWMCSLSSAVVTPPAGSTRSASVCVTTTSIESAVLIASMLAVRLLTVVPVRRRDLAGSWSVSDVRNVAWRVVFAMYALGEYGGSGGGNEGDGKGGDGDRG